MMEPIYLENEGGQSFKMGSWSDYGDQEASRGGTAGYRAKKNLTVIEDLALLMHVQLFAVILCSLWALLL